MTFALFVLLLFPDGNVFEVRVSQDLSAHECRVAITRLQRVASVNDATLIATRCVKELRI